LSINLVNALRIISVELLLQESAAEIILRALTRLTDKKAQLPQRWPRDAPYIWVIWVPWKLLEILGFIVSC